MITEVHRRKIYSSFKCSDFILFANIFEKISMDNKSQFRKAERCHTLSVKCGADIKFIKVTEQIVHPIIVSAAKLRL